MWTSSRTRLRRLEAAWHQPAARFPHFPLVARYYDHVQHEPAYQRLPDQTWVDLNGDLLFSLLDATVSPVGQQGEVGRWMLREHPATAVSGCDAQLVQ